MTTKEQQTMEKLVEWDENVAREWNANRGGEWVG